MRRREHHTDSPLTLFDYICKVCGRHKSLRATKSPASINQAPKLVKNGGKMLDKNLSAPLNKDDILQLHMGDEVLVNGTIYAARDAAHKKMVESLLKGEELPFDVNGQIIYYVGPCPAPPGKVIGSAGPTTSGRMDAYAPLLIEKGLRAMIGKGDRNQDVVNAMRKFGAVYLAAVGGAGAYLAKKITAAEIIAYPELGPEALMKMQVVDFPCVVAIDSYGNNIYIRDDK